MNELERRAYGKIAQALTERTYQVAVGDLRADALASEFPEAPRPIFAHDSNSSFESLARVLWPLHILTPLDPNDKGWAYRFAFACRVEESDQVAERNWQYGPSLSELLETFIDFFDGYGKEYYDFSSAAFVPFGRTGRMDHVLDALASLGYVERTSEGYVWLDVEPVMRILYGFKSMSDPEAFNPRS
jgi:hypothetical protein